MTVLSRVKKMRRLTFALALLPLVLPLSAHAQQRPGAALVTNQNGSVSAGVVDLPASSGGLFIGCTVGTTSAQCLQAAAAAAPVTTTHLMIQNTSASASIACSWGGTAALNSSGSFMLAPGQGRDWGPGIGWAPTLALNCIATVAGTPLYVEYN